MDVVEDADAADGAAGECDGAAVEAQFDVPGDRAGAGWNRDQDEPLPWCGVGGVHDVDVEVCIRQAFTSPITSVVRFCRNPNNTITNAAYSGITRGRPVGPSYAINPATWAYNQPIFS